MPDTIKPPNHVIADMDDLEAITLALFMDAEFLLYKREGRWRMRRVGDRWSPYSFRTKGNAARGYLRKVLDIV